MDWAWSFVGGDSSADCGLLAAPSEAASLLVSRVIPPSEACVLPAVLDFRALVDPPAKGMCASPVVQISLKDPSTDVKQSQLVVMYIPD